MINKKAAHKNPNPYTKSHRRQNLSSIKPNRETEQTKRTDQEHGNKPTKAWYVKWRGTRKTDNFNISLHRPTGRYGVTFNVLSVVHKALNGLAPPCISGFPTDYKSIRPLRSSGGGLLLLLCLECNHRLVRTPLVTEDLFMEQTASWPEAQQH